MPRFLNLSPTIRSGTLTVLISGALVISSNSAFSASCTVRSGATRATLVELYTSEGCSSCPPADRWLSGFVNKVAQASPIIPLAFHVDYWDYIGWSDRFASAKFTARQQERVRSNRGSFSYTPQILINGHDSNAWREVRATGKLDPMATSAPGAELVMHIDTYPGGKISVDLGTKLLNASDVGRAVVYLALFENGLSSSIGAGENAGRQLRHDFVVRDWIGPLPVGYLGEDKINHVFTRSDVVPGNTGVAALVELADGSRLLQALSGPLCHGAGS